jgi:rfaE bifunctional protein kinase chain/domain
MKRERLEEILSKFASHRIVLFGDFFLDKYVELDPALNEISIETGKTAYQVVGRRPQPGAAGTVCNNLVALGVRHLAALTVIGEDGEGYDLRQQLTKRGIDIENVLVSPERFTPTYMKPMLQNPGGEEELERMDTKNRAALPAHLEEALCQRLEQMVRGADAVIIADQVQERNCGVISDRVRDFIATLAPRYPKVLFFADSRERIGEFRNLTVKPNRHETVKAVDGEGGDTATPHAIYAAQQLFLQNGKPVFLTLDKEGVCPIFGEEPVIVPCPPVDEPIDIVGAGDSTTAGMVSALASGAKYLETAVVGNLVASITIRQLGTTGTASPAQVLAMFDRHEGLYAEY